ncbi:MAG: response regulator transcription factor [Flavobacteriales bacterium]|nr:response regulator transcription factor [Flavobacteriales bacterium]
MKVVIIEDEQPAVRRLQRLIGEVRPGTDILSVMDSVADAVEYFTSQPAPDLVFLDIHLADGLSFEIFGQVKLASPVIFTTAYDHYAVRAFKVNSVDYLLKPVDETELRNAFEKLESFRQLPPSIDLAAIIGKISPTSRTYRKRYLVRPAGRIAFVNVEDIAYFFSDDGRSFLVTKAGDRFLLDLTMEEIESELDPQSFFRINRAMMVSLGSIKKIEPHFNNRYSLELAPPFEEEVMVSRQRGSEFKSWLDS